MDRGLGGGNRTPVGVTHDDELVGVARLDAVLLLSERVQLALAQLFERFALLDARHQLLAFRLSVLLSTSDDLGLAEDLSLEHVDVPKAELQGFDVEAAGEALPLQL